MEIEYFLYKQKVIAEYEYLTYMQNNNKKINENLELKDKIIKKHIESKEKSKEELKFGDYFPKRDIFDTKTREKIRDKLRDNYEKIHDYKS